MSGSIRLSEKYGVNPSVAICWICGADNGEVILAGRMKNDAEAPRRAVWDKYPCAECRTFMEQGIIFVSVMDGSEGNNPCRTGKFAVIREDAVRRMVTPAELRDAIIKKRVAFVPDSAWARLGLPVAEGPARKRA